VRARGNCEEDIETECKGMKKIRKPLKKIGTELLSISCALLLLTLLCSFTVLAENTDVSGKIGTNDKISATLSSKIAESPAAEQIPVIIVLNNQNIQFNNVQGKSKIESEQQNIMNLLNEAKSSKKAQKIKPIHIVNAVAATVTPEVLAALAQRPDILKIEPDEVVSIADDQLLPLKQKNPSGFRKSDAWGVDKIGAPKVWQQGITGKGITVAVIDSGIDATHPDLDDLDDNSGTKDPKVVGWVDYINGKKSPYDDFGHGTRIAGIISGTGASGVRTGVAPGTKLIGAKVFDQSGSGYMSDVILAFEWAVKNGARIISFSGGGLHNSSFTIAMDKVVAAGVIPIVAAGNSGPDSKTITCPGDEINSTTVGATNTSDFICFFSSRGPVDLYKRHYIKPDVSAPGIDITSTVPVWYGCSYENMSGTSVAAPYVSGTVALMLEKNPTLKPSEIKQILESTAVDLGPVGKDNKYGSGRINSYEAVFCKPGPSCKLQY
jgi:serine protease AprX